MGRCVFTVVPAVLSNSHNQGGRLTRTDLSQGQFNNQRLVSASATFTWLSKWGGREVFITGDFTAWTVRPQNDPIDTLVLCPALPR